MRRRPQRSTRTDTPVPYTTLFRSGAWNSTAATGSAQRGIASTPSVGASALAVAPGRGTADELLASVDSGLFVTSMAGLHSGVNPRSEEHTSELQSLMRNSYAVFCLKKKKNNKQKLKREYRYN